MLYAPIYYAICFFAIKHRIFRANNDALTTINTNQDHGMCMEALEPILEVKLHTLCLSEPTPTMSTSAESSEALAFLSVLLVSNI